MGSSFLEYAHVENFGAWHNKKIGPFGRHLNVVFGRNEAGKTTFASFVDGVLFGWERKSRNHNDYKPVGAERAGKLLFATASDDSDVARADANATASAAASATARADTRASARADAGEGAKGDDVSRASDVFGGASRTDDFAELNRGANVDGLQGDTQLVSDIDVDTYRTMFSLTSDELLSLRDTKNMTSNFLTAGSGTATSPAAVLAILDGQIKDFTSRAEGKENSLYHLKAASDDVRSRIQSAQEDADRHREEERELQDLKPRREELVGRERALTERIDVLTSCRANLASALADEASIDEDIERCREEARSAHEEQQALGHQDAEEQAHEEQQALEQQAHEEQQALEQQALEQQALEQQALEQQALEHQDAEELSDLSPLKERSMRSRIDELADRESGQKAVLAEARERSREASARFEALSESQETSGDAKSRTRTLKIVQIVALTITFAILLLVGVMLVVFGIAARSILYTALGAVFVVVALVFAGAVLYLYFHSRKDSSLDDAQIASARQDALQEQKKLELCENEMFDLREQIADELAQMGLGEAGSSLSSARGMLDDAKERRMSAEQCRQREQKAKRDEEQAVSRRAQLADREAAIREKAGISPDETLDDIDHTIAGLNRDREDLRKESAEVHRRWGELTKELEHAQNMHELDHLRNRAQELKTRTAEAQRDLARLLLARHMLEEAVAAWEKESQPEVYACAGRLLELMTDGRWSRIDLIDDGTDGTFQISDRTHEAIPSYKLSMGTRQQLYLSLRIALLMCVESVGSCIPVIADDVLVNFDATRRVGAARALAELAKTRQVIVLTCHEEVVDVMRAVDASATVVEL